MRAALGRPVAVVLTIVGGLQSHLARNETDAPVEMTVVYMRGHAPAADGDMRTEPPPGGCPV